LPLRRIGLAGNRIGQRSVRTSSQETGFPAEVDYLLGQRFGDHARRAFLRDLAAARFTVTGLDRDDYSTVLELESRYTDLQLGLADCALVILAERYDTTRIVSFDERRFRAVSPLNAEAFTILPADT
jgi:uncharacterized protein